MEICNQKGLTTYIHFSIVFKINIFIGIRYIDTFKKEFTSQHLIFVSAKHAGIFRILSKANEKRI